MMARVFLQIRLSLEHLRNKRIVWNHPDKIVIIGVFQKLVTILSVVSIIVTLQVSTKVLDQSFKIKNLAHNQVKATY